MKEFLQFWKARGHSSKNKSKRGSISRPQSSNLRIPKIDCIRIHIDVVTLSFSVIEGIGEVAEDDL